MILINQNKSFSKLTRFKSKNSLNFQSIFLILVKDKNESSFSLFKHFVE
jgi:hypothetical protein